MKIDWSNEYRKRDTERERRRYELYAPGQSLVGKKVIIIMQRCTSLEISGESHLKEGVSNAAMATLTFYIIREKKWE